KGGSSPAETDLAFDAWEDMARQSGLSVARVRSQARGSKLASALRQHGLDAWREACRKVGQSSFCRGETDRGWKADLDFLLQANSFVRVLEGHYDDRPSARDGPSRSRNPRPDPFKAIDEELADEQDRSRRSDSRDRDDAHGVSVLTI